MRVLKPILILAFLAWSAAAAEAVFVKEVMDDRAIIVRRNGDAYLIEKGVGCLSLRRFEGKSVYIRSPGLFLGVGARLLIPDLGQECRILDSESLGTAAVGPVTRSSPLQMEPGGGTDNFSVLQRAFQILGYDLPTVGTLGDRTKEAFAQYANSKGHSATDAGVRLAMLSLAIDVLEKRPSPPDALLIAEKLSSAAKGELPASTEKGCIDGHWIASVIGSGKLIKLEDGSLWEVDAGDTIYSMLWLPNEGVLACGQMLINAENREKVKATRRK